MEAARPKGAPLIYTYFMAKCPRCAILYATMDDEGRKLAILILFILGAAVGFYLARFFF